MARRRAPDQIRFLAAGGDKRGRGQGEDRRGQGYHEASPEETRGYRQRSRRPARGFNESRSPPNGRHHLCLGRDNPFALASRAREADDARKPTTERQEGEGFVKIRCRTVRSTEWKRIADRLVLRRPNRTAVEQKWNAGGRVGRRRGHGQTRVGRTHGLRDILFRDRLESADVRVALLFPFAVFLLSSSITYLYHHQYVPVPVVKNGGRQKVQSWTLSLPSLSLFISSPSLSAFSRWPTGDPRIIYRTTAVSYFTFAISPLLCLSTLPPTRIPAGRPSDARVAAQPHTRQSNT